MNPANGGKLTVAEDGVAHVRGLIGPDQQAVLREAIEYCRANPGPNFRTLSPEGKPVVQSDLFRWSDVEAIRSVAMEGPLPRLAAKVLGSDSVILLEDQWFYSATGSGTPSPWHQDHPYHPIEPWFLTIWIPLDPVPGPVGIRAVPGSHRGDVFAPVEFSAGKATLDAGDIVLRPVPAVDDEPHVFPVYVPETDPGDGVLLDSRTLHAAGGLCEATFRRLSIRYARHDTRFRLRPWPVAAFWAEHDTEEGGDSLPCRVPGAFPSLTSPLRAWPGEFCRTVGMWPILAMPRRWLSPRPDEVHCHPADGLGVGYGRLLERRRIGHRQVLDRNPADRRPQVMEGFVGGNRRNVARGAAGVARLVGDDEPTCLPNRRKN